MDLNTWCNAESGRASRLQEYLTSVLRTSDPGKEIADAQFWQWRREDGDPRKRPIPATMALAIEEFTKGEVMRWESRPKDWFLYWPELKKYSGAPPLPTVSPATADEAAALSKT